MFGGSVPGTLLENAANGIVDSLHVFSTLGYPRYIQTYQRSVFLVLPPFLLIPLMVKSRGLAMKVSNAGKIIYKG
jgi:hypothetical protein